jgi:hypothetical protein
MLNTNTASSVTENGRFRETSDSLKFWTSSSIGLIDRQGDLAHLISPG